ncbi:uncharacterized protein METZ01_LOCUS146318, partial [marine metagenome]
HGYTLYTLFHPVRLREYLAESVNSM